MRAVALRKGSVSVFIREQRRHAADFHFHRHAVLQAFGQLAEGHGNSRVRIHCRADGREEMGVIRRDNLVSCKAQRADKRIFQLRQKVQRAAEKCDVAADRLAAGQAADCLIDDCLEDGRSEIRLGCALVDQRLNIRFGEHAAARRNRIDGLIRFRIFVQTGCVRL